MYLIGLTTCCSYSDYLAVTLPNNMRHLDGMVVVTDEKDGETADVAISNLAQLEKTNDFYRGHADFNKGAGINYGIGRVLEGIKNMAMITGSDASKDFFLLHLDADILLPPDFKDFITQYPLDPDSIYGCPRMICPNNAAWKAMKAAGTWGDDAWERQNKGLEARHKAGKAGYFQLWNAGAKCLGGVAGMPWYPESSPHAGKSDSLFMRKFPELNRHELPIEVIELHQNYVKGDPMAGANWKGRVTERFDG